MRSSQEKWFGSIVYASNNGKERRKLWQDLEIQSRISKGMPWVIIGDFNVTRKANEHTAGGSFVTEDMQEFNDCLNSIEADDSGSVGFHYTWTRSLKNHNCGILKKLDRILINEEFLTKFPQASGIFLLYIISDHSPAVVRLTNNLVKPSKAFRFMNYVAFKDDFMDTVEKEWAKDIEGYAMFRLVKKLNILKEA
ncbi:uncharacterized protein [Rutidosis leptorrhynchoides]|uniref:uncharacterized protein n=1 Tax=Rutidosis leptorrhynchoides TaxID=125765 RepID=UPI003A996D57